LVLGTAKLARHDFPLKIAAVFPADERVKPSRQSYVYFKHEALADFADAGE